MAGRVLPAISGPAAKSSERMSRTEAAGWVEELRTDMDRALRSQGVGIVAAGAARRYRCEWSTELQSCAIAIMMSTPPIAMVAAIPNHLLALLPSSDMRSRKY